MNPNMTRRNFLRLSLAGAATLALPLGACSFDFGGGLVGKTVRSTATLPCPFGVPLLIPPRLEPIESNADGDIYELTQREAQVEILPGLSTTIWGYNGIFPGPTIEARRGRQIIVRAHNQLPVPTVIHLHGGLTAPEHDGYPIDFILLDGWQGNEHAGHGAPEMPPGNVSQGSRDYVYPLDQRAATLWYHDHRMDFTGPQVYKGLAGFLIVHDDQDDALSLPKGDKDIALMLADRLFGEDGAFLYPSRDPSLLGEPGVESDFRDGVLGDAILVNGAPWPYHEVSATRHRFRVLNAANARRYELELDPPPPDGPAFVQVGSDGGLLAAPVNHNRLEISPAERYDLVIDFGRYPAGTRVTLKNRLGDGSTGQIMQFHVTHREPEDSAIPAQLSEIERLDPDDATTTRSFRFHAGDVHGTRGWLVDDDPFHPNNIAASPNYDDTEIWELRGNTHHPIHLHLVHFQVLSRDGRNPSARDAGWKDTVNLNSGQQVRVIARVTGHRGKYVFHCHNLEHEDMAMMANFEVV